MIKWDKNCWVYGVLFMGDGKSQDFLGSVQRNLLTNEWHFIYRFRYYKDDKTQDSDDKKSWYHWATKENGDKNEPPESMLSVIKEIRKTGKQQFGATRDEFVKLQCMGNDPKVMFEVGSRDWATPKVGL